MSSTPNIVMRSLAWLLAMGVVAAACGGSDTSSAPDAAAPCVPPTSGTAPTYSELFLRYFAPGTSGHCANDACHNGPNFNTWMCGLNKDSCYKGMTMAGLIDPKNPTASLIGDPKNSPLSWINPNGPMPFDTPGPFPEGREAILAWVSACAQNN